jgi:hypothetical protein
MYLSSERRADFGIDFAGQPKILIYCEHDAWAAFSLG